MNHEIEIIKNSHYKEDLQYAIKLNRWLLYLTGCWPMNHSILLQIFFRIINCVIIFSLTVLLLPMLLAPIFIYDDNSQKIKEICLVIVGFGYVTKYTTLACSVKKIKFCIEQIDKDWCYILNGSRNVMLRYAKFNRSSTMILVVLTATVLISWEIVATGKVDTMIDNVTVHSLSFPAYYVVFDGRFDPYFDYVKIFQLFVYYPIFVLSANTNCIIITLLLHVCGQYEILANIIMKFASCDWLGDTNFNDYLGCIIKKHYTLMR